MGGLVAGRPHAVQTLSRLRTSYSRPFSTGLRRCQSGIKTQTVSDSDIQRSAAKPSHPSTLGDSVQHGRPPLSEKQLLKSANFTLSISPSRLAHRIQSLRSLPYIVVANPHVSKIHSNYVHSLSTLLPYAEKHIDTSQDETNFTEVMADSVQTHANTISILARGFLEARRYISPEEVTRFLDEHLRARIGTRSIAEQHIALHFSSQPHRELSSSDSSYSSPESPDSQSTYIGVIDTALKPASVIRHCESMVGEICELKYGVRPHVVINGEPDTTFAHIPMHLEYILTELSKNAFRATIEKGMEREPIEVTIAPAPEETRKAHGHDSDATSSAPGMGPGITNFDQGSVDAASESNKPAATASANIRPSARSTPGVTIRIRDRGGGISPENFAKLWDYGFTTFNEDQISDTIAQKYSGNGNGNGNGGGGLDAISGVGGGSSLAGLGYGSPSGRAYAEYFGGGIAVQSLWGWGTDVYLSLRGVGKVDD